MAKKVTGQALRRRWPISKEKRLEVLREMFTLLQASPSENIRIRAANIILQAERTDNALIIAASYGHKPSVNVQVNVDVQSKEIEVFGVIDSLAFSQAAERMAQEDKPKEITAIGDDLTDSPGSM